MSEALEIRAEILKLARLLRREPQQLAYLEGVPAGEIRVLREQITDVMFAAHGNALDRLATGSKLLPIPLVATLAERVFGAVLSARVAGMLDPGRAVEMASRLPIDFLADIAVEIDPRRASAVIGRIPPAQIAAITRELVNRGEYVTMGRFVGHLHNAAIAAAAGAIDDSALLQIAFVLESKASLTELIGVLPPARLDGIMQAAGAGNLWPEVLDLLAHLSDEQRATLVQRASAWDDGSTLASLLEAAQREGMWAELLPLVPVLPPEGRERVAALVAGLELDEGAVQQLAGAVIEHDLWEPVLIIAEQMSEPELQRVAARLAEPVSAMDRAERALIAQRARTAGLMDRLGPLSDALLDARQGSSNP